MPDCEKYDGLLSAYIDGALLGSERKQVDDHLKTCAECRKYLALLQTIREDLREPAPEPPKELVTGILYKISLEKKNRRKRILRYGAWTGIAAVICLAVFGVVRMNGTDLSKTGTDSAITLRADKKEAVSDATGGTMFTEEASSENEAMDGAAYNGMMDAQRYDAAEPAASESASVEYKLAKSNSEDLPGYSIAMDLLKSSDYYSICFFHYRLDKGVDTGSWQELTAPEGQRRWLAPAEDLAELEVNSSCDEIYYGDLAAESGLVVVLTEMED